MKVALLLFLAVSSSAAASVDESVMLWAIGSVESGNDPRAIGKIRRERSEWQFMPGTWTQYTDAPFERATTDPSLARRVARQHLDAIVHRLERNRKPVTPQNIARAWNPGAPTDYAQRITNLYLDRWASR